MVCYSRNVALRSVILALALLFAPGIVMAQEPASPQNTAVTSGTWSGVIINSGCTADEAFAEDAKCTAKDVPGTKLVLYDDTTRQMFVLDPQEPAAGHLGDSVTVSGTVDGTTLHVASFKMLTDIGLAVGQKAPPFTVRDQSGREQSLATLQGLNGTVLLFFRSADW